MKKNVLIVLLLAISWQANSQETKSADLKRNELKLDVAYLLDATVKVEYEYLFNDWSSAGVAAFHNFSSSPYYQTQVLGLYRLYFGKEPMRGFFLEGNMGLVINGNYGRYPYDSYSTNTAFGAGIALGWKWFIPKSNVILDLYAGFGRMFGESDTFDMGYPRLGICVGKRF